MPLQQVAPPSPQLDAMMDPAPSERAPSRSTRRSFRARVGDTFHRTRGRSSSPVPPTSDHGTTTEGSPSKNGMGRFFRKSMDRARSPAPAPAPEAPATHTPTRGRNSDVIYSYTAPEFEVPELNDWQLYDGTSVPVNLHDMNHNTPMYDAIPAPPSPRDMHALPMQAPDALAHLHFRPGQVVPTTSTHGLPGSLTSPRVTSPDSVAQEHPSVQPRAVAMQAPNVPAVMQESRMPRAAPLPMAASLDGALSSPKAPPAPAPAEAASPPVWAPHGPDVPLFGHTAPRARSGRQSLGVQRSPAPDAPAQSAAQSSAQSTAQSEVQSAAESAAPEALPAELVRTGQEAHDARAEADIFNAYAEPSVDAPETGNTTVIEHHDEPAAPKYAPTVPTDGQAWRTYDTDESEYDETQLSMDGATSTLDPTRLAPTPQVDAASDKQQRLLDAMNKAPDGAGLTDLMNRVVAPERQSWLRSLWPRKSSDASTVAASVRSASGEHGVIFRGADVSPSLYSHASMEPISDQASLTGPLSPPLGRSASDSYEDGVPFVRVARPRSVSHQSEDEREAFEARRRTLLQAKEILAEEKRQGMSLDSEHVLRSATPVVPHRSSDVAPPTPEKDVPRTAAQPTPTITKTDTAPSPALSHASAAPGATPALPTDEVHTEVVHVGAPSAATPPDHAAPTLGSPAPAPEDQAPPVPRKSSIKAPFMHEALPAVPEALVHTETAHAETYVQPSHEGYEQHVGYEQWPQAGTEQHWPQAGTEQHWPQADTEQHWQQTGTEEHWQQTGTEQHWQHTGTEQHWQHTGYETADGAQYEQWTAEQYEQWQAQHGYDQWYPQQADGYEQPATEHTVYEQPAHPATDVSAQPDSHAFEHDAPYSIEQPWSVVQPEQAQPAAPEPVAKTPTVYLSTEPTAVPDISYHDNHQWEAPKNGWQHPDGPWQHQGQPAPTHQIPRKAPPGTQRPPVPRQSSNSMHTPRPRSVLLTATEPKVASAPTSASMPTKPTKPAIPQILPPPDDSEGSIIVENGRRYKGDGFGGLIALDEPSPKPESVAATPSLGSEHRSEAATPRPPLVQSMRSDFHPEEGRATSVLSVHMPLGAHGGLPDISSAPSVTRSATVAHGAPAARVAPPPPPASHRHSMPPGGTGAPFQIVPELYTTPQSLGATVGRMTWTPEMAEAAAKYIQSMTSSASHSSKQPMAQGTSRELVPGAPELLPPPMSPGPVPQLPEIGAPGTAMTLSRSVVQQLHERGIDVALEAGEGTDIDQLPLQRALQEMMIRFYFYERHAVPALRDIDKRLVAMEHWSMLDPDAAAAPPPWNQDAVARISSEVRREVRSLMLGAKMLNESRLQIQSIAHDQDHDRKRKRPDSARGPSKRWVSRSTDASSRTPSINTISSIDSDSASSSSTLRTTITTVPVPPLATLSAPPTPTARRSLPTPQGPPLLSAIMAPSPGMPWTSPQLAESSGMRTPSMRRRSLPTAPVLTNDDEVLMPPAPMFAQDATPVLSTAQDMELERATTMLPERQDAEDSVYSTMSAPDESKASATETASTADDASKEADETIKAADEDPKDVVSPPEAEFRAPTPTVPVTRARSSLLASLKRADERARSPAPQSPKPATPKPESPAEPQPAPATPEPEPATKPTPARAPLASVSNVVATPTKSPSSGLRARAQKYWENVEKGSAPVQAPEPVRSENHTPKRGSALTASLRRRMAPFEPPRS